MDMKAARQGGERDVAWIKHANLRITIKKVSNPKANMGFPTYIIGFVDGLEILHLPHKVSVWPGFCG